MRATQLSFAGSTQVTPEIREARNYRDSRRGREEASRKPLTYRVITTVLDGRRGSSDLAANTVGNGARPYENIRSWPRGGAPVT